MRRVHQRARRPQHAGLHRVADGSAVVLAGKMIENVELRHDLQAVAMAGRQKPANALFGVAVRARRIDRRDAGLHGQLKGEAASASSGRPDRFAIPYGMRPGLRGPRSARCEADRSYRRRKDSAARGHSSNRQRVARRAPSGRRNRLFDVRKREAACCSPRRYRGAAQARPAGGDVVLGVHSRTCVTADPWRHMLAVCGPSGGITGPAQSLNREDFGAESIRQTIPRRVGAEVLQLLSDERSDQVVDKGAVGVHVVCGEADNDSVLGQSRRRVEIDSRTSGRASETCDVRFRKDSRDRIVGGVVEVATDRFSPLFAARRPRSGPETACRLSAAAPWQAAWSMPGGPELPPSPAVPSCAARSCSQSSGQRVADAAENFRAGGPSRVPGTSADLARAHSSVLMRGSRPAQNPAHGSTAGRVPGCNAPPRRCPLRAMPSNTSPRDLSGASSLDDV